MITNDKVFNMMMSEAAGPMEYSGTLPLDLEEFPYVPSPQILIDQGFAKEGDFSNIVTSTFDVDDKTWLLPTMRKGQVLSEEEINNMILNNEHFGIYNSPDEANWMDQQIHEQFNSMYGI